MKIAIISDSHDNVPNIEKFLDWANKNKIEMIIHCGDIAAPGVVKKLLAEKFKGGMHLVHGNVSDRESLESICGNLDNVTLHGDIGELEIDGIKVGFCHRPDEADELVATGKYNIVFYGHTHKPWIDTVDNVSVVNPGTLGGLFQKATFAVYTTEDKDIKLFVLEQL
jgi:uncharacterized protein